MAPLPGCSPPSSPPLAPPSPSSSPAAHHGSGSAHDDYAHIVRSLQRRSVDRCASLPSLAGGAAGEAPPPPALEADLRLAAQIGQTLLGEKTALQGRLDAAERAKEKLLDRLAGSVKEAVGLQRRLDEATANLDSADASNRALLVSLEDDRKTISRLSSDAGKAVAASTALKHLQRSHDDLAQELSAERKRADAADAKGRKLAVRVAELEERLARANADLDEMRQDKVLSARRSLDALNRARSAGTARGALQPLAMAQAEGEEALGPNPEAKELLRMVETLARENTLLRSESMELRGLLDDSRDEQCDLRSAIAAAQDVLPVPEEDEDDRVSMGGDDEPRRRRLSLASSAFSAQFDSPDLSSVGAAGDASFPSWASSSLSHSARAADLSRTISASSNEDVPAAAGPSRRIGVLARPPPVSSASTGAIGLGRRPPPAAAAARGHSRRAMSMDVTPPFTGSAPTSPRVDYSPSTRPASIFSTTSEDHEPRPRRHHRPLSLSLGPSVFPLVPEDDDDGTASRPVSPFTRQPPPSAHRRRSSQAPSLTGLGFGLGAPFPSPRPGPSPRRSHSPERERADAATQTTPPATPRPLLPRVREPSPTPSTPAASDVSRSASPRPAPSSSSSVSVHSQDAASTAAAAAAQRAEQRTAALAQLIEHAAKLLGRVQGADIATQEKRLRKQNLPGDVRHLAQANLRDLVHDIDSVRTHFRRVVELERASHARSASPSTSAAGADASLVTRRDFVSLVKLVRDLLFEASRLRMLVNRVQLDPPLAATLRDLDVPDAFDALEAKRAAPIAGGAPSAGGLLAPLSRLFGGVAGVGADGEHSTAALGHKPSSAQLRVPPAKRGGSSTVSTATVNVEFGSGQVRQAEAVGGSPVGRVLAPPAQTGQPRQASVRRELASIFAGASSRSTTAAAAADPWIVVPPSVAATPIAVDAHSAAPAGRLASAASSAASYIPFGRLLSSYRPAMSSTTNAVLDSLPHAPGPAPAHDAPIPPTLLERQLRPRGLSDSSIRSTYLSHANPHHRVVTAAGLALSAESSRAAALSASSSSALSASPAAPGAGAMDTLRVQLDPAALPDNSSLGRSLSRRPSAAQLRARASSSRLRESSPPPPVPPLMTSAAVAAAPSSATSESSLSLRMSSPVVEAIAIAQSPPGAGAAGLLGSLASSAFGSLAKQATGAGREDWKERGRMG
ncbi:hypothetical protein JCM10450v2_001427 [Rhodotorula kratochvilovae]